MFLPGKISAEHKKVLFLTGTRADFGKQKSLILKMQEYPSFAVHVFVTGMHTLAKYGSTWDEVRKSGVHNFHTFINQSSGDPMDLVLAKTITGLSDYIKELQPDLLIIHGDRLEALAGAIVGAFNNIIVGHIEGGEVSGTIDEAIRHSVSKLAHVHFVSNDLAKKRLRAMGEQSDNIHVIGSPDLDIMRSKNLPDFDQVLKYYDIPFRSFAILLFHPVTTEISNLGRQLDILMRAIDGTEHNYVVIFPNNDPGSDLIIEKYRSLVQRKKYKLIPSMRFEYFLSLMKNSQFLLGNSSAGIREAPFYGIPSINVGTRQNGRAQAPMIISCDFNVETIIANCHKVSGKRYKPVSEFGYGNSAELFFDLFKRNLIFDINVQKRFLD